MSSDVVEGQETLSPYTESNEDEKGSVKGDAKEVRKF